MHSLGRIFTFKNSFLVAIAIKTKKIFSHFLVIAREKNLSFTWGPLIFRRKMAKLIEELLKGRIIIKELHSCKHNFLIKIVDCNLKIIKSENFAYISIHICTVKIKKVLVNRDCK